MNATTAFFADATPRQALSEAAFVKRAALEMRRGPQEFGEYDDNLRREYARYLVDSGRHAEAVREIDGLMAAGVADGTDYEMRGLCRLGIDSEVALTLALSDFDEAQRRLGADWQRVQIHAAVCLNRLGRHVEAIERANEASTVEKYPEAAMHERIDALIGLKQTSNLIGALNAYAPKCPAMRARAGAVLRASGRNAEALGQYAIVARATPDDRHTLWAIGDCLAALGRRSEAASWFERAERAYRANGDPINAEICLRACDEARGRRSVLAWLLAR